MKDKITILIADDNPDFAKTLTGYIEEDEELEIKEEVPKKKRGRKKKTEETA